MVHNEALLITTHFSLEVQLITYICNLISTDSLVDVANAGA